MVISKLRRLILFILLAILCIYFAIIFFVDLNDISKRELDQASFQITEYLVIINKFSEEISILGENYLKIDDVKIDEYLDNIEYGSNFTFSSNDQLMDLNRRIIGRGTDYTVTNDNYFMNLAYIFDRFFRDFSTDFENIVSISYFSNHNFVYTYSNVGSNYLSKVGFYQEKNKFNEKITLLGDSKNVYWQFLEDESYLNSKELVANIPVYDDDNIEGIISINYSIDFINQILDDNTYQTFLIDTNGTIVASNVDRAVLKNGFANIKDADFFGNETGTILTDYAFNKSDYSLTNNLSHFTFSKVIENQYVLLTYVPAHSYLFGVIYSILSALVIAKIVIWLDNTYYEIRKSRKSLDEKYIETKTLKDEVERLSKVDFLTNLYNRRYMLDCIRDEKLLNTNNDNATLTLILIDIDRFKSVNDTYGHSIGDVVLKSVSNAILSSVRENDLVARWGGEEILVMLTNTSYQDSISIAENIRLAVQNTVITIDELTLSVTISLGVNRINIQDNFEKSLTDTDTALYEAKSSGRNKVVSFNEIK